MKKIQNKIVRKKIALLAGLLALLLLCSACGGTSVNSGTVSNVFPGNSSGIGSTSNLGSFPGIGNTPSTSLPSGNGSTSSTGNVSSVGSTSNTGNVSSVGNPEIPEKVTMTDSHVYTFYNSATNSYLSCNGQSLVLSQTPTNWMLKNANGKGFHLYAHETNLLMDIDNANVAVGTTVKLWTATGHDVQIWNINRNANGTYSILYSGDNQFCLGFAGERPVLQRWDGINKMQEWIVTDISETLQKDYLSFKSNGNIIELQLPLDILNFISEARLKQWANELEAAYYTFYELTNFVPFQNIIVEAYKPSQYIGWVTEHSNVIHIDNAFIYGDLEKMAVRASDWNFCALHEMGHMFDFGRPWNFETELMTDFKLAYVLEKNHVAASPSEFDASTVFYGKDIRTAYASLGNDFSTNYDIYGCAERFLQIKEDIGWEPIKQTFHAMQANEASYRSYSKQAKLEAFVSLLSGYSNRDVKSYFSAAEWNTLLQKCQ